MSATEWEALLKTGLTLAKPTVQKEGDRHAAVAIILADASADILFIKRPIHPADPWSGHVALPGGRHEPLDPHLEATARRETWEEVGLQLSAELCWGALTPILATARVTIHPVWVTAHVYRIPDFAPALKLNAGEAVSARWIPLEQLLHPRHQSQVEVRRDGLNLKFPSWVVDDYTIWGLTYLIVRTFLGPLLKGTGRAI
jgi:8-oxo-dGTP pyrophosphatase MutT (NUDIX family)